ncbi:MAG: 2-amino-4-hydroxy-6-hydroxymethyldihydropteridine diphosphokinase [Lachnospiraceae bacterium]|nr:2-amino-4-hydroxy-6-hydroxymethyldihydropteridine diphosphokinase [Lachnospiraceae bacterium]
MDKIIIEDLECFGYHGVLKEEQVLGQKFLVSIILYTNTQIAGKNDCLDKTLNYAEVCKKVQTFMHEQKFLLIEAAAEHLAQMLLLSYSLLKEVKITIKKPWAPVHISMKTVAVEIKRGWHTVYLGIGANLGDKEKNIQTAINFFKEHPLCKLGKISSLLSTKPYGVKVQDDFLNGVFGIQTLMTPREILACIQEIEEKLQRVRTMHWGPRTIDVDILLYDNLICREEDLIIPHIEMHKRDFVLKPLCEIAPYILHPIYQKNIQELWEQLQKSEIYESNLK